MTSSSSKQILKKLQGALVPEEVCITSWENLDESPQVTAVKFNRFNSTWSVPDESF